MPITRLAAAGLLALALPAGHAVAAEPLKVVASFSILGDMVARIGGDRIAVTTLVGPNGDAHVYQPTPADAEAVANADVVVVNGLGFEGFLGRLVAAAEYKGPVVVAAAAVKPIEGFDAEADEHDAADAAHEEEEHAEAPHEPHDHGDLDPHAWQDLGNGRAYVAAIADGLCAADAAGCSGYEANAAAYDAELAALDAAVRTRIAAIPAGRRKIITSHDAFGYFGRAYGVTFMAPQGISTESEASASDVAALIRQVRETGIKVLFVENITDPRLAERIAAETGARVGGELYSDALTPPGADGATYLGMMKHNADALISAMSEAS